MSVELHFQEPGQAQGSLLNELIRLGGTATSGGGIFAWASESGLLALLHHEVFVDLLDRGAFDLVVGTDTITSPQALRALRELARRQPALSVRAFLHDTQALFHPKCAWFNVKAEELVLVVGSGNLTSSGLLANWEIYTTIRVRGEERLVIQEQIAAWRASHADHLLDLSDPRVVVRVQGNKAEERTLLRSRIGAPPPAPSPADSSTAVLVAEPTYAAGRASQANFHLEIFEGFFGAERDVDSWHVFYTIAPDGSVTKRETLKAITTPSGNFRFELGAPSGTADGSYPIGVFLRLASGELLYQMLVPGDEGFAAMSDLLTDRAGLSRRPSHRQQIVAVEDLRQYWPGAPVLRAELPAG
jgi:hypothetical protein